MPIMKSFMSRVALIIMATALVAGAVGCSKKPKNLTPLPAGQSKSTAPTGDVPIGGGGTVPGAGRLPSTSPGLGSNDLGSGNNTNPNPTSLNENLDARNNVENRDVFAADTIYFDFDKSNVKPEFAGNITKVADHLKAHPTESLLIEGNCDERGTPEYNLALGERRALAIREKLMAAGISGDRVTTISFGEEKPADPGHTDAAYAKNRRGVFVLLTPPGAAIQ